MTEVTVFVDDAVRGDLPAVCCKDGTPTDDRLLVRTPVGDGARLGVFWLLLLAGPIGWVALLFTMSSRSSGGEVLSVEVPMSAMAHERILVAGRAVRRGWFVVGLGIVVVLSAAAEASLLDGIPEQVRAFAGLALVLLGAVLAVGADRRRRQATVDVTLDASRRWVTVGPVHPAFRAACEVQERERHQLRR